MRDVSKEEKVVDGTTRRAEPAAEPATLTILETAKRLRIGLNSAYAGVKSGAIPVIRIGRRLLVPRAALETLLAAGELIERTGASSRPVGYPSGGLGQFVDRIRRSTPVENAHIDGPDHEHIDGPDHEHIDGPDHAHIDGPDHEHIDGPDHEHINGLDHKRINGAAPVNDHDAEASWGPDQATKLTNQREGETS